MRTVGVGHEDALWLGRRHGAAALSGLVGIVASAAAAFVLQVGRRRRAGGAETVLGAAPLGTELAPPRGGTDLPDKSTTTPVSGIHDAAGPAPPSAGEQKQSVYGVGFDQHSAHARGRPIAWVVVAVIITGTFVSGISLIVAAGSFWTGVGVVVLGIILGR
ncbi:MAG TPA: hypothetical protein VFG00_08735 [Acidothermaceae bacterium]|nr:hypothetical protein [Acidothermaceae bacterium]